MVLYDSQQVVDTCYSKLFEKSILRAHRDMDSGDDNKKSLDDQGISLLRHLPMKSEEVFSVVSFFQSMILSPDFRCRTDFQVYCLKSLNL